MLRRLFGLLGVCGAIACSLVEPYPGAGGCVEAACLGNDGVCYLCGQGVCSKSGAGICSEPQGGVHCCWDEGGDGSVDTPLASGAGSGANQPAPGDAMPIEPNADGSCPGGSCYQTCAAGEEPYCCLTCVGGECTDSPELYESWSCSGLTVNGWTCCSQLKEEETGESGGSEGKEPEMPPPPPPYPDPDQGEDDGGGDGASDGEGGSITCDDDCTFYSGCGGCQIDVCVCAGSTGCSAAYYKVGGTRYYCNNCGDCYDAAQAAAAALMSCCS